METHLGRCFLDLEPGIHYPQLQMQAGVTGINALRIYNVTKQGKDQDPDGKFIRRYLPELARVPLEHLHEPWKMPRKLQVQLGCLIGEDAPLSSPQPQLPQQPAAYGCVSI